MDHLWPLAAQPSLGSVGRLTRRAVDREILGRHDEEVAHVGLLGVPIRVALVLAGFRPPRRLVVGPGEAVAEIGPGAVVDERAAREGGIRSATLRATTRARVAEASPDELQPVELDALASTHRREEAGSSDA